MASVFLPLEDENYVRMSLLLTGISPRAVRVLFDHEFAPVCLYSSLKKECTKLRELKKQHRINQPQWDLLFPLSPGVPDSKQFDITLMITLLRNLTTITPPAGGYDRLPTPSEMTPDADLARIKFYRNRLAHLDDTKIDHASFLTDWNDVTSAISRIGGKEFQLECAHLKTKSLDQTSQEIMLEIKSANDDIRELKQSLKDLTIQIEISQQDTIPRNVKDDHQDTIRDWEKEDETFFETRASEHVMSWLSKCNIAVVTGSSGTGKSFLIHHAALELHRQKNCDIIPLSFVTAPSDIINYKSKIRSQVFVIDDICGKGTINEPFVNIWKDLSDKVKSVFKSNFTVTEDTITAKLLISCRLHVFNDPRFKSLTLFTENAFNLLSEPLRLLPEERLLLIKKYLKSEQIDHVMSHILAFDFFPLLCKMSKNVSSDKLKLFFSSPIHAIKEQIERIKDTDKYQLCALILCILFEDGFEEAWLKNRLKTSPITLRKKLIEITINCDIDLDREIARQSLRNGFTTLLGTLLKKRGTKFGMIHDTIYQIASVVCAPSFEEVFIRYANEFFIGNAYIFKSIETNPIDEVIILSEEMEAEYFERLLDDLKQQNIYSTLHNNQLVHKSFRDKLLRYLNNNVEDLKDVFNQIDKNGLKFDLEDHLWYESDSDDSSDDSSDEYKARDTTYPLIEAATEGYVDIVEFLIQMNCNLNHIDSFDRSALYRACEGGFHDVVKILLDHGADASLYHEDKSSPLHMACKAGSTFIVKLLLAKNADVCKLDRDNISPLCVACEQGNATIVRLLLQNEADVDIPDLWKKHCALHVACEAGHLDVVKLLITNNADVNNITEFHDTPLSLACKGNFPDVVKELLENKAFSTSRKESPLFIACENKNARIVKMLLDSNTDVYPDINESDKIIHSPLAAACASNQVYIMQLLLQNCSDKISYFDMCFSMRTASIYGCTDIVKEFFKNADVLLGAERDSVINESMYLACEGGNIETVQYFLSQGIDVFQCSETGRSLLHATCNFFGEDDEHEEGRKSVISLLIQNKLEISKPDENGFSPLHLACRNGLFSVSEILIDNKANVNMTNNELNWSPLHFVCQMIEPNIDIVEVLLKNKAHFELCDNAGRTPLHVICERCKDKSYLRRDMNENVTRFFVDISTKCQSIVKLLIGYDADVNSSDNEGETPLHKACMYGDYDLVKTIISSGKSDLNLRSNKGQTPLYLACKFMYQHITKILLEGKADSNIVDNEGKSPLQISSEILKSNEKERIDLLERNEVEDADYLNDECNILKNIVSLLNKYNADMSQS